MRSAARAGKPVVGWLLICQRQITSECKHANWTGQESSDMTELYRQESQVAQLPLTNPERNCRNDLCRKRSARRVTNSPELHAVHPWPSRCS